MRGMMARANSHDQNVGAAIGPTVRDRSPDDPMGRSGCCGGFLRLGTRKRGKRIAPATRIHDGSNSSSRTWAANGAPQSGGSNQYASLSPSLLAPPSSPASFQNSAVQSSAQSPATFSVSLSVPSATSQIPETPSMFQMGPYAHETALVSPPVFSTFTTAPSTAPFTPPPEPATHVTTPSSPDVPFAQLLANSFGTKGPVRQQPAPTYSASPFASPDIFQAEDLQAAYQLYPGSPLAHLLSPTSGTGQSTPFPDLELSSLSSPFPDLEIPVQAVATMFFPGSPLLALESSSMMEVDVGSLLSQALNPGSFQEFRLDEKPTKPYILLENGANASTPETIRHAGLHLEDDVKDEDNKLGGCSEDDCQDGGNVGESMELPKCGLNLPNPESLEGQQVVGRFSGEVSEDEDQETDLFVLPLVDSRSLSEPYEHADREQIQLTTFSKVSDRSVLKSSCNEKDYSIKASEISAASNMKPLDCNTSKGNQCSDEMGSSGILASDQTPSKWISFKPSHVHEERVDANPSRSSKDLSSVSEKSEPTDSFYGGDCADCDRLQHFSVATSKSSNDIVVVVPQQQIFPGLKGRELLVCGGENKKNCCGRCDEMEARCDKLTMALQQAMEKLAEIEVKEKVAVYREQQLKAVVHWMQSGAKSHQKCVDGVSEQLSGLGSTDVDSKFGLLTELDSSLLRMCDRSNEADCIASNLIILENKIRRVVEENLSNGNANLRFDNLMTLTNNMSPGLSCPGLDKLLGRLEGSDNAR